MKANPQKPNVAHLILSPALGGLETCAALWHNLRNTQPSCKSTFLVCLEDAPANGMRLSDAPDLILHARRQRFPWDRRAIQNLRQFIGDNDIRILHSHNTAARQYASIARAACPGLRHIYTDHGTNLHLEGRVNRLRLAYMRRRTDAWCAVSSEAARRLAEAEGLPADAVHVIPNGILVPPQMPNISKRRQERENGHTEWNVQSQYVIGYVGRLSTEKGVDRLIQAVASMHVRCDLVIIGEGPQRDALVAQANSLAMTERVHFHGGIPQARHLMNAFDLLVLPSRSEGLPMVLLEAMAEGCLVAATDTGECRTVLDNGKAGTLLPGHEEVWPTVLDELLGTRETAPVQHMVANAFSRVSESYDVSKTLALYESVYKTGRADTQARPAGHKRFASERLPGRTGKGAGPTMITISNLYPTPDNPVRGMFNAQLFSALAARATVWNLALCAAPPWRFTAIREWKCPTSEPPSTRYVPYLHIPIMGRFFSDRLVAHAVLPACAETQEPTAVLASWLYPDGIAAAAVFRNRGVPVWIMVLGSDRFHLLSRIRRQRILAATPAVAGWICVTPHIADALTDAGIPADRVHVIPNGVDPHRFYPQDKFAARRELERSGIIHFNEPSYYLLWIGNLEPVKDPQTAIDAISELMSPRSEESTPAPILVMIGDGSLRRRLHQRLQGTAMAERIFLVGRRPHEEIPQWLNAVDGLLLSSRSEGMPNAITEALACGCPVTATDTGVCREMLQDQPCCQIAPVGDSKAFAHAINAMLQARQQTEQRPRFTRTWQRMADEMLECIAS
ncbi:MAG TPA: hypothetical protein DCS43_06540 [Verrucomicrobia bacterium]|nr:hypothetical protein [Verrucomicrobiota bacterium]